MEIFTTGAYLYNKEIDGRHYWVVADFSEPCYWQETVVTPKESADTYEELLGNLKDYE